MFGTGLQRNVGEAYRFLMKVYHYVDKHDGYRDELLAYISAQSKKNKKIIGGIVARANPGVWKVYQGKGKDLTDNFTNPGWHTLLLLT